MCKSGVAIGTALTLLLTFAANSSGKYSGGLGTAAEPFRISAVPDWQELMATPADWAGHFILTSDIDLNGVSITPIAPDTSTSSGFQGTPFTGVFDGNDYVIRNADVNMPDSDYVGLFGYLGTGGQINNLGVEDTSVFGSNCTGGLVGCSYGNISHCYSTGSVSGDDYVGGLVGVSVGGAVSNCHSTGAVSGTDNVGGLVGDNSRDSSIINCYSTGSVSGVDYVGGLVGHNHSTISNCYSTGSATATGKCVAGLVGRNYSAISDCYSVGEVRGVDYVGGLVGENAGPATSSFWDLDTSGWPTSAGGTPKTTVEMKTQSTFTSAGWDFIGETANGTDDIWSICEGTNYPRFVWQIPAADWICPDGVGLEDFSYLGGVWGTADPDPANLDGEDGIGFGDLMIFCELWLSGR